MDNVRLKLSPPWSMYISKVEALFDGDPQIECNTNHFSADPYIILSCSNGDKVAALQQILPFEVQFGNVALKIVIDGISSNRVFHSKRELFETAFEKNPAFAYVISPTEDEYAWFAMTYVVFKNHVVQFFADNLNDCHGIVSTLYQNIAEEVFTGIDGVYFNTDVEDDSLGAPIDKWL